MCQRLWANRLTLLIEDINLAWSQGSLHEEASIVSVQQRTR